MTDWWLPDMRNGGWEKWMKVVKKEERIRGEFQGGNLEHSIWEIRNEQRRFWNKKERLEGAEWGLRNQVEKVWGSQERGPWGKRKAESMRYYRGSEGRREGTKLVKCFWWMVRKDGSNIVHGIYRLRGHWGPVL